MAKAFLSHSSKDKQLVDKIALQLGRNNCHYDKMTFEAGKETIREIFEGLSNTDVFVLFLSENALKSNWVKKELTAAKKLKSSDVIQRIFPLIIDKKISYSDPRIPGWIKKSYNVKNFYNEVLILKKIRQFLRESNFRKHDHLRELNNLFVGRHKLIQEFERRVITIDNSKPTGIIASSFFEGIGRRTFIKNGLIKTRIIDNWYSPVTIPINKNESIEDFIYKLSFINNNQSIFNHDFSTLDLSEKINLATDIVYEFVSSGEVLFIIDEGSIVLPNSTLVPWFSKVFKSDKFQNQVSFCLISKFKPYVPALRKEGNYISFQVDELSIPDTQVFFLQYLRILEKEISPDDTKFFLNYLKGIPGQIIYTAELIRSVGVQEAKRYVDDIEQFDEIRALSLFKFLDKDHFSKQILISLSKFEIISYDLIYKIFGESEQTNKAIQKLFNLSLLFSISSTNEYLKLNSSISDYIDRSRIELDKNFEHKISDITKEALKKPLELNENSDYSEFLLSLGTMLRKNIPIPKKYLIPSFILKSIITEYKKRKYKNVVELAEKILENENKFDFQIIMETKIWLCLAYCRTQNSKFFQTVSFLNNAYHENRIQYFFLMGFFFRNGDQMQKAEKHYLKVLEIDNSHSRTKRELVNVYLRRGEYMKALDWAEENYHRFKTNILHIQAYFTCLIRKKSLTMEEREDINELLEGAHKSYDTRAEDLYGQMLAEHNFYVKNDLDGAVNSLENILQRKPNNYFTFRALADIYSRNNMHNELTSLTKKYPHLIESTFE